MQFDILLHPIAMKEHQSFTLTLSQLQAPMRRPFIAVAAIVAALCFLLPVAKAQRMLLEVPLPACTKDTAITDLPKQPINSNGIISGIITDSTGAPQFGATVMLLPVSGKIGTVTNEEGKFRLEIPASYTKDSAILRVTYVGFISQQIQLSLLHENDHVEVCLLLDNRRVGCPPITPTKRQAATHQISHDLTESPVLIKLPNSKRSTTK